MGACDGTSEKLDNEWTSQRMVPVLQRHAKHESFGREEVCTSGGELGTSKAFTCFRTTFAFGSAKDHFYLLSICNGLFAFSPSSH